MKHIHLIGLPRSGTTYLSRVIQEYYSPESVAQVKTIRDDLNEPFRDTDVSVVDKFLEKLYQSQYPLVIKSHYCHLPNYMEKINKFDFYNIGLLRKDIWETSMSLAIANHKNQWFDYDTNSFEMDIELYDKCLQNCLGALDEFKQNKCNIDFDEIIYYEDLSLDPRTDFSKLKLCDKSFDNLQDVILHETFRPAPCKKDIVLNYNQIRDYYCDVITENKY